MRSRAFEIGYQFAKEAQDKEAFLQRIFGRGGQAAQKVAPKAKRIQQGARPPAGSNKTLIERTTPDPALARPLRGQLGPMPTGPMVTR